ncbi:P-loop containing nucleoside triphosphate hydrolase protein [Obelidium mucronatum]|nr:P-loop containing nucleoside triphosphate hydrolase protein [Obelidium mucronatum]
MPLSRTGSSSSLASQSQAKLPQLPSKSSTKALSRSNSVKNLCDSGVTDLRAISMPPSALRNIVAETDSPARPAFPNPEPTPVNPSFPGGPLPDKKPPSDLDSSRKHAATESSPTLDGPDHFPLIPKDHSIEALRSSTPISRSTSNGSLTNLASAYSLSPSLSYDQQAIKVVVRVRNTDLAGPPSHTNSIALEHNLGADGLPKTCIKILNGNTVEIQEPPTCSGEAPGHGTTANATRPFHFDTIFGMDAMQETVYGTAVEPLIRKCLEGFNGCIFAYGQTAAGKTHTMQGPANRIAETLRDNCSTLHSDIGIILRVVHQLNEHVKLHRGKVDEATGNCLDFVVKVSYLEIYNENLVDLLVDKDKQGTVSFFFFKKLWEKLGSFTVNVLETLKIRMEHGSTSTKDLYVQNLSERYIMSLQDYVKILNTGAKNRSIGETNMNAQSSRSHAILTITIDQYLVEPKKPQSVAALGVLERAESSGSLAPEVPIPEEHSPQVLQKIGQGRKRSKIHLIDLAGSERADSTGATGDRLKEGAQINQSLSALGNVISALTSPMSNSGKGNKQQHIPYRDSKLTHLLSDSLGGNALTLMITCCSPLAKNYSETVSTFRFAERVKRVMNKAVVNMDPFLLRIAKLEEDNAAFKKMEIEYLELKKRLEDCKCGV